MASNDSSADNSGSKLFVGGLSWGTDDAALHSAFSQYGEIESANVIIDKTNGRSKGFGFVSFTTRESAQDAVDKMNGTELDGRTIRVDFASSNQGGNRGPRRGSPYGSGRGGGGGGFGGGRSGYRGGRGGGGYSGGGGYRRGGGGFNDREPGRSEGNWGRD